MSQKNSPQSQEPKDETEISLAVGNKDDDHRAFSKPRSKIDMVF